MDGASKFIEKQSKAAKKQSGSKPGKFEVDSLPQLQGMPGVRVIKRKK